MRTIHLCQTYGNAGHKEVRPWRTQHTDKHKPTGCGSMLSPDDYHWAEKRGDTTGQSLMYSLAAILLLLGITSPSRRSRQELFTFSSAASYP